MHNIGNSTISSFDVIRDEYIFLNKQKQTLWQIAKHHSPVWISAMGWLQKKKKKSDGDKYCENGIDFLYIN